MELSPGARETLIAHQPQTTDGRKRRWTARVRVAGAFILQVDVFILCAPAYEYDPLSALKFGGLTLLLQLGVYFGLRFKFPVAARAHRLATIIFWAIPIISVLVLFLEIALGVIKIPE